MEKFDLKLTKLDFKNTQIGLKDGHRTAAHNQSKEICMTTWRPVLGFKMLMANLTNKRDEEG